MPPGLTTASLSAAKVTYGKETAEKITVAVKATTPTPAGQVTVATNTNQLLCSITLKNGAGDCKLTAKKLKAGTYTVVDRYRSAAPYTTSSSAAKTLKVTG